MWAVRPAARAELPDLTPTQCIALALARHVQDPFESVCHMLSPSGLELTQLPLSPLVGELPEPLLRAALSAELVDATCQRGVSVLEALTHPHRGAGTF